MNELQIVNLGLTAYQPTWVLQKKIFDLRFNNKISDTLLLTQHDHVYTLGKVGKDAHLLADESELKAFGSEVHHVDRGGDITYHGPGQLVGYPILDLNNYYLDIHRYLRDIEEVLIRTLNDFGIKGHREGNYTGVWVGSEKIAAIGIKVSRWVTMHGFALNINTDLSYYDRIIPCGIFHKGVTSMEKILGNKVGFQNVIKSVLSNFGDVFEVRPKIVVKEEILSTIENLSNKKIEYFQ